MNLELSEEERALLSEVLEGRRQELHPEIRHCMDHAYKDTLRRKLEICKALFGTIAPRRRRGLAHC